MPFGNLIWGSCQYDTAADFYLNYVKEDSDKMKRKLSKVGVKFEFTQVNSFEVIKQAAREFFQKNYFEDDFWKEEVPDMRQKFNRIKNINGLFNFMRNQAFDLWTAAHLIAEWTFKNLKIVCPDNSETYGPSLNQVVQMENNRTGLYCLLLTKYADVSERAFKGFDT